KQTTRNTAMTDALPSQPDLDPPDASAVTPRHGFQGDRAAGPARPAFPAALTIALSREAGARGSSIAGRTAGKLGWQVYSQELLEYIAQEGNFRQAVVDNLPADAAAWVEGRLDSLLSSEGLTRHTPLLNLARVVLALGAYGRVIL